MSERSDGPEVSFGPNRGRVVGWAGTVVAAVGGIAVLIAGHDLGTARGGVAALLFALVVWANLLRPKIVIDAGVITLVNAFRDVSIPAATVTGVSVRNFVKIEVGARTYAGVSIGHGTRALMRGDADRARGMVVEPGKVPVVHSYAVYVVERLEQAVEAAQQAGTGSGPVTKSWARVPCGAAAVLAAALVVLVLV